MRHEDISIALGIHRDTLAKYFEAELTQGALARRMEVLNAMHAAAKKGSSSAAKAYMQFEPQLAAPPVPEGAAAMPAPAPKEQPVGKKEQAQADAVTAQAGTEWADLLPRAALPQ
jgi:hypothetical protein